MNAAPQRKLHTLNAALRPGGKSQLNFISLHFITSQSLQRRSGNFSFSACNFFPLFFTHTAHTDCSSCRLVSVGHLSAPSLAAADREPRGPSSPLGGGPAAPSEAEGVKRRPGRARWWKSEGGGKKRLQENGREIGTLGMNECNQPRAEQRLSRLRRISSISFRHRSMEHYRKTDREGDTGGRQTAAFPFRFPLFPL